MTARSPNYNAVALQVMDGTSDGATTEIAAVKPFRLASH
jgi:hypothetical protein